MTALIVIIVVLGVGTYTMRLGGAVLGDRLRISDRVARLLPLAAVALIAALVATSALVDNAQFAGVARPVGVLAGLTAALLRAPFVVAVVLAAAVAAGLRALGLP